MKVTRYRVHQAIVFTILWCAYGSTYLLRKPVGIIKGDMEQELKLSTASLGWLDVALLLPYAVVSIFFGSTGDQIGPRATLSGGLLGAALACVSFGSWNSMGLFLGLLALNGMFQSLYWPSAYSLLGRWFVDKEKNIAFGMFGTSCFVGGLAGSALCVYFQTMYGWRVVFIPASLIAVFFSIAVWGVRNFPEDSETIVSAKNENHTEIHDTDEKLKGYSQGFMYTWGLPTVPELSVCMFCIKMVRYTIMMWLPLFLLRSLDYSKAQAGIFSTMFEIGGVIGSASAGLVIDHLFHGRILLGCSVAVFCSAVCMVIFIMTSSWGLLVNSTLLFLAGAFNCGPDVMLVGSVPVQIGNRYGSSATAIVGVSNGMGSLGTVLEGPMVGILTSLFGWNAMFPFMVLLTLVGAMAVYRGHSIQQQIERLDHINSYVP
ncbi:uncharacterized protein LOC143032475 [Oratosquilla oratoria]|uniref:uncharacterized protein LOC143032475 n=1 Tax=Oratosquilla oratoria TaxID=337810 RepID=UPI003F760299